MCNNNLFQLVHSLSKEEKRYFKLSIPLKKTNELPKYVRLFNILEKQKSYDEMALRVNKFHAADRNYLMEKLLESLVAFNKQKSIEAQLHQLLAQLPILYQKKLWALLEKRIQQGQKIALAHELYWFYLKLLEWEFQLCLKHKPTSQQLSDINQQQTLYIEQLGQTYNYLHLKKQIALLLSRNLQGAAAQQSKARVLLKESPLTKEACSVRGLGNQIYFYQLKSRQAILEEKYLIAYQHIRECKHLFNQNADFRSINEGWYQEVLCMHLEIQLMARQFESIPQILQELKKGSYTSSKTVDLVCNAINFKALLYFFRIGDLDNCFLIIEDLQKNWATYQPLLKPSREITYYYNIAVIYLCNESWEESHKWLYKILALKLPSIRKDLQYGTRILLLILTYELDKSDLFKTIDTTYKYFNRHQKYGDFERQVIQHFKQLYKAFGTQEEGVIFSNLRLSLESLDRRISGRDELLLWCESKVEGMGLKPYFLNRVGAG